MSMNHESALALWRQHLLFGLSALDLRLDAADLLIEYLQLLVQWNRAYNLTAVRDPIAMISRHLLDSLSIHPYVLSGTVVDLGSGAGLPGVPLAIVKPQCQVTLVESNGKKARFLREVVRQLKLSHVVVAQTRAEEFKPVRTFDYVTARALDTLSGILRVGEHLLGQEGQLLAMKGGVPHDEIAKLPGSWSVVTVCPLLVPNVAEARHLVILRRRQTNAASGTISSAPAAGGGGLNVTFPPVVIPHKPGRYF